MPRPFGTTGHQALTAAPAVGPAGATYYDSTLKLSFLSDGTRWLEVSSEYIASRGPGLVTNGSALLGTTYDWTTYYSLVKSDHPVGAAGSFQFIGTAPAIGMCDEFIPVDPAGFYDMTFAFRQVAGDGTRRFYSFIAPYDADKLSISPAFYMEQTTSARTTLAADLKVGDTTITLTSSANWNNAAGANSHFRTVLVWGYTDGQGYAWPPYTYSRNAKTDAYADGGISGNVITLRVPWAGLPAPAGTPVSNGSAGGSFQYGAANLLGPATWTDYRYRYGGVHTNNLLPATTAFSVATSYVKVGFLHNYPAGATDPTSVTRIGNVNLVQVSAAARQGPPVGGTTNQVLAKKSATDYDTQWVAPDSPPTGAAGGDLAGTYPNPQIAAGVIVDADISSSAAIAQSKISGLTAALTAPPDTGWLDMTGWASGWVAGGGPGGAMMWQARQIGNVVYLRGNVKADAFTGTNVVVCNLAGAITPPSQTIGFQIVGSTVVRWGSVLATGQVQVTSGSATPGSWLQIVGYYLTD